MSNFLVPYDSAAESDGGQNLPKYLRVSTYIIYTVIIAALLSAIAFLIYSVFGRELGILAVINGKPVGFVSGLRACSMAEQTLENESLADFDCSVTYRFKLTDGRPHYLTYDDCVKLMTDRSESHFGDAYSLYIDGKYIASASSEAELEAVVASLEAHLTEFEAASNSSADSVRLTNSIVISKEEISTLKLMSESDIVRMFTRSAKTPPSSTSGPQSVSVEAVTSLDGENLTEDDERVGIRLDFVADVDTSLDYGIPRVEFTESANYIDLLEYDVVTHEVYTEIVPFTVEYVNSPYYYEGLTFKSQDGSDGITERVYEVVLRDGRVVSNTLSATNVISEMQPETYTVGTKEPPPAEATGVYLWPLQNDFMLSSYYGIYRGEFDGDGFHYGLDLTGKIGDYIYAADGGTVIHSGKRSTYGICVIIEHDDHYKTYYAHMDEALVEEGEKVYPGQLIGKIGMTGLTTGPHLHFEIRKDNYPVDPMEYMPEH